MSKMADFLLSLTHREALGCPFWKMIVNIGWRSARPGILTGILLALARISGETAPLLFTSLNNQFASAGFGKTVCIPDIKAMSDITLGMLSDALM